MIQLSRSLTSERDDEGASAVEYGLLVAAIAAIVVLIVIALGGFVQDAFSKTCQGLDDNMPLSNTQGGTCSK